MTKVFVTGALGVIGNFLVPYFKNHGYDVLSSDVLVRDYDDYIRADVTLFEDLYRIFKEDNIDIVIHMAGEVGRMVGEQYPQKMVYVNNIGTLNIIKLCLEYDCKLIYFSTSEVYGHLLDNAKIVTEEGLEKKGNMFIATNIYALSKIFGEAMVKHYVENYGLKAVTIRPFMIYGPGEYPSKYRSALSNFIFWALSGKKITVHKGAVRSWCYISDFIDGIYLVVKQNFSENYQAYNIGSNEYHTMEEVGKIVIDECGGDYNQIEIVEPPNKFLSLAKRFSIEKIRLLGYMPKISLKEGVHKVVEWQREVIFKTNSKNPID